MSSHGTATSADTKVNKIRLAQRDPLPSPLRDRPYLVEVGIGHHVVMANHVAASYTSMQAGVSWRGGRPPKP